MNSNESDQAATDDAPLDAAEMLELLQNQRRSVQSQMGSFVPLITSAWGVAWLAGFGALWSIDGLRPGFALPLTPAVVIFVVAMIFGIAVSMWFGIRSSRGIRSNAATAFTGALYGVTWSIGSIAIGVLGAGFAGRGMSPELANYYYASTYVFFVGIMYLIAGAIWRAILAAIAGAALVVIAVIAPFIPYPSHYLFFALAGGGTFLVLALVSQLYLRRVKALAATGARRG